MSMQPEKHNSPGKEDEVRALGRHIRRMRHAREWTLEEAARRSGLAPSTWSKVEKGQMSPTFDVLLRFASGLGTDVADLFRDHASPEPSARRTVTRTGQGHVLASPTYDYEVLCAELARKKLLPLLARIRARNLSEFSSLTRHEGEEFLYVLTGRIVLHTEHYAPMELGSGDSAYFDSTMGHALVAVSEEEPLVLWVTTETKGPLAPE